MMWCLLDVMQTSDVKICLSTSVLRHSCSMDTFIICPLPWYNLTALQNTSRAITVTIQNNNGLKHILRAEVELQFKWNFRFNISKEFKLHAKNELSAWNCNRADFVYQPSKHLEFGLPFHIRIYKFNIHRNQWESKRLGCTGVPKLLSIPILFLSIPLLQPD